MRERLKGHFGDRASFGLTRDEAAGVTVARIAMPHVKDRGMIRAVLVDDEPPARVRMRQLLDAAGDVTVVGEAGSAVEAREVIRDTRPDLLFLDVEMPRGARHRAGRVAARAAAVHRVCDRVRSTTRSTPSPSTPPTTC